MKPKLIDSHCHLHFPAYGDGLSAVLERMQASEVAAITVGTTAKTSQAGIAFAQQHQNIYATVGHHPEHLTSSFEDEYEGADDPFDFDELKDLAADPKVVSIGETGLDFFRIDPDRNRQEAEQLQEDVFRKHIALAEEVDKPMTIHCREAGDRFISIIADEKKRGRRIRGVMHCYTGDWEEAQKLLDLGLYISFTGIVTFGVKKSSDPEKHVHRVIERMPLDRMMIETDAPWLAPEPHRGEQNEPAYVEYVARKIAELRGMECEEIANITTENAIRFFNLQ
ncbi:MAG: TatD family hydrolase [Patescibacteria group bacterium]|nr:TatD family hydrolase [Patescibacteria group bacterium]